VCTVGHFRGACPRVGSRWRVEPPLWSYRDMPPAAVLGEIWGTRRGDTFDQSCRSS